MGPGWLYEVKLDGYRAVAFKSDRGVDLFSRRHKLFSHQYSYLVEALNDLPGGTVVDLLYLQCIAGSDPP